MNNTSIRFVKTISTVGLVLHLLWIVLRVGAFICPDVILQLQHVPDTLMYEQSASFAMPLPIIYPLLSCALYLLAYYLLRSAKPASSGLLFGLIFAGVVLLPCVGALLSSLNRVLIARLYSNAALAAYSFVETGISWAGYFKHISASALLSAAAINWACAERQEGAMPTPSHTNE